MCNVAMYLRKSRCDEDFERQYSTEDETLLKHKNTLLKLAQTQNLQIVKIYEEIVSGETLIHRIGMIELLRDVENKLFYAVLCMDIDRLGRGNMQEQGIILDTFKQSNTKIITPRKTYDLNNEFDEEYSEFEAFMSRKEFKLINRRLQRGRIRAIEDGNYICPIPPYGFTKHNSTLIPNPEQDYVVRLIFDLYVNKCMGSGQISNELNSTGIKSYTGTKWTPSSIINILKNPVYIGKIIWKRKEIKKSSDPFKIRDVHLRPRSEWLINDGKHQSLVSEWTFNKANEILKQKYHTPYQLKNTIRNPLAGLIVCKVCGAKMMFRPYKEKDPHIVCVKKCGNKSSKFIYIERILVCLLEEMLKNYIIKIQHTVMSKHNNVDKYVINIQYLKKECSKLKLQHLKIHDLLEQGIYDINTFRVREKEILQKLSNINTNIENLQAKIQIDSKSSNYKEMHNIQKIIDVYKHTPDVKKKNFLLKSVIRKIEYYKPKTKKNDDFLVTIFFKI